MSTQPSAPGRASSRFSRPVGYVRDLPIWTKLGLIMIVPTLATIIVGTNGLLDQVEQASNADRARALAVLSGDGGDLVACAAGRAGHAVIQLLERAASRTTERAQGRVRHTPAADRHRQRAGTGSAGPRWPTSRRTCAALLDRIETQLGELPVLRSQVAQRLRGAADHRRAPVPDPHRRPARRSATSRPSSTGDTTLTDRMRAAAAVAAAKEFLAQERGVVLQALANGNMSQAVRRDYIATLKGQELALMNFTSVDHARAAGVLRADGTGPELREAAQVRGRAGQPASGPEPGRGGRRRPPGTGPWSAGPT